VQKQHTLSTVVAMVTVAVAEAVSSRCSVVVWPQILILGSWPNSWCKSTFGDKLQRKLKMAGHDRKTCSTPTSASLALLQPIRFHHCNTLNAPGCTVSTTKFRGNGSNSLIGILLTKRWSLAVLKKFRSLLHTACQMQ